jgi:hypothetical protein
MTYKEAYEMAFKVEWKVSPCFDGAKCWCRIIVPKVPIKYDDPHSNIKQKLVIVSAGSLDKKTATHIVNVHNAFVHVANRLR